MIAARQIYLGASRGNAEEEMWKELFVGLTENTLPETVVIPADVTKVGRQFWLMSSTCKDITFMSDMSSFANNNTGYGSANLKTVRMPNQTSITYPSPLMNGNVEEIYIPKVKMFGSLQNTFATNGSKLDVYITESTCAQIMTFTNFPGTNNATQMAKLKFIGSDGYITYNGSSWVITPNS